MAPARRADLVVRATVAMLHEADRRPTVSSPDLVVAAARKRRLLR
jgi:hypothetical protein